MVGWDHGEELANSKAQKGKGLVLCCLHARPPSFPLRLRNLESSVMEQDRALDIWLRASSLKACLRPCLHRGGSGKIPHSYVSQSPFTFHVYLEFLKYIVFF